MAATAERSRKSAIGSQDGGKDRGRERVAESVGCGLGEGVIAGYPIAERLLKTLHSRPHSLKLEQPYSSMQGRRLEYRRCR